MNALLVLPIVIPLLTATISLVAWSSDRAQRGLGVGGMIALCIAAGGLFYAVTTQGIQAMQIGDWPAPFGITLVADALSATLVLLAAGLGLLVAIYSLADIDAPRQRFGYFPLTHIMVAGICGAFLTGDIFNLYVCFEVMLIASFVLLALGGGRAQMEGAIKYVTINLLSSAIFLAAVGILYAEAQTLNMGDLSLRLEEIAAVNPHLVLAVESMFIVCFGIKAAVFPLFFWLPESYPTPPAAISAIFAGLLTKVGVYALIRVFTLVFPASAYIDGLLLVIAALTMLIGVLGAVCQYEFRRILSFHSISQIGYMIAGLGLIISEDEAVRRLGLAAALVYMVHHTIVKSNLFFVSGAVAARRGTYQLKPLGGLIKETPWLALLFMISALSLAGIPPLSGFWAKFGVVKAGLLGGQYLLVAAALATGIFTLISMIKIWNEAFWKPAPPHDGSPPVSPTGNAEHPYRNALYVVPIVALAIVTVALGLWPEPFLAVADQAAGQMLDNSQYLEAIGLAPQATGLASTPEVELVFGGTP